MVKPKRWALVGTGGIVRRLLQELRHTPELDFRAVVSSDRQRGRAFAQEFGITVACTGLEELLRRDDIDAVYVATFNTLHVEQTIACLEAGFPVLCEKPLAVLPVGVENVQRAVGRTGVFAMEAMKTIFMPTLHKGLEWAEQGRLGEIREIRASFCFRSPAGPEARQFNASLGGGSILDIGYYGVEAARWFLGPDWNEITATGHIGPTGVDVQALIALRYPGGILATTHCAFNFASPVTLEVLGTEGRLHFAEFNQPPAVDFIPHRGSPERFEGGGGVFIHEVREVGRCIDEGLTQSPVMPLAATLATSRTLDNALRIVHKAPMPASSTPRS